MYYYITFKTEFGWIGAFSSSEGLVKTTLPQISEELSCSLLATETFQAVLSKDLFKDLRKFYDDYFAGKSTTYQGSLDLSQATSFQRSVWLAALRIPYGETRSYSWIAGSIGSPQSCRAVGNALGKNPLPIIVPCHRVIKADGGQGGFGGGLELKSKLQKLETSQGNIFENPSS
jgi:methylated-DNA-[protein]-cysteine S-methyltransferase